MLGKKVDANQKLIVGAFRQLGWTIFVTSDTGAGFPDTVGGYRGKNYLFEIKDGEKPLSAQKLTVPQQMFHENWRGQVTIIRSVQDVIDFTNSLNKEGKP
jgi:hypothetical protein